MKMYAVIIESKFLLLHSSKYFQKDVIILNQKIDQASASFKIDSTVEVND